MSIISLYPATELSRVTYAVFLRNIAKAAFVVKVISNSLEFYLFTVDFVS